MSATTAIQNGFGKSAPAQSGESFPRPGEISKMLISKFKKMYGDAPVILGRWLRISDKTAKRKLKGEREVSLEDYVKLLRDKQGFEFLSVAMEGSDAEWWRLCSVLMDAADIRKMQIAAQRRAAKVLKGVLDADRDLSEAIQRAETLAFYGSEQAGVQADALREINRVSDRPVAKGRVK